MEIKFVDRNAILPNGTVAGWIGYSHNKSEELRFSANMSLPCRPQHAWNSHKFKTQEMAETKLEAMINRWFLGLNK